LLARAQIGNIPQMSPQIKHDITEVFSKYHNNLVQ